MYTLVLQLLTTEYPAKILMSADDEILYNAQYYIHFLAMNSDISAADDDDDDANDEVDNSDCKHFISLHELLTFSRLQKACDGDISVLR